MDGFNKKRIADPVHDTIGLSELEARVIDTKVFQRLRNIKQLGLAYLVFPGADYSRFSHSVGVCHVTGLILDNLRRNANQEIPDREVQLYRLAGLLHDVGHYPFSHAMEHAISNHFSNRLTTGQEPIEFHKHESVSKHVLLSDTELKSVLTDSGFRPEEIYRIFNREQPPRFANLVSSDLDADRIDYMLRTAHHTGLPYGSVDINYLLSQLRVDGDERLCLTDKAIRTAEHFLLCRYFDYQQVVFHKTVAALEWILKDVLIYLLEIGSIDGSAAWVQRSIEDGAWQTFDDAYVTAKIRDLAGREGDNLIGQKAVALLERKPPKLLVELEYIEESTEKDKRSFLTSKQVIREKIAAWAEEFDVPGEAFHLWDPGITTLTKIGSRIPISTVMEHAEGSEDDQEEHDKKAGKERDKYEQSIRILYRDTSKSVPIMDKPSSLLCVLSDRALFSCRLYVLLPPGRDRSAIEAMRQRIKKDCPSLEWK